MSSPLRWLVGSLILLALLVATLMWLIFDGLVLSRGDAATEELPPSERGAATTTTLPQIVSTPNQESNASRSGERFRELTCEFTGASTLEPPLRIDLFASGAPHDMGLTQGARFECDDATGASAGTIELDASFESLTAFAGVASGNGRITWSEVAPSERVPGELTPSSNTAVEVQLDYPVIVVWTTIVDGPYAGFRGRLVLREWEQIRNRAGEIVGIEFDRTRTTFAPA